MNIPEGLKYTKSHEWVLVDGSRAKVGITDFAQHELTDIVFVELPEIGAECKQGQAAAVIESVKTAVDVYAPLSGPVVEINGNLVEAPETVNNDPYGTGWMFVVELKDKAEINSLLTPEAYKTEIGA